MKKLTVAVSFLAVMAAYAVLPFSLLALTGCEDRPEAPKSKNLPSTNAWRLSSPGDDILVDKVQIDGKAFYVFRRYNSNGGLMVVPAEPELEKSR